MLKIRKIEVEDNVMFNNYYKKYQNQKYFYQNNFDYITQACRGFGELGGIIELKNSLYPIGVHNEHFTIVNPVGQDIHNGIIAVLNTLTLIKQLPVYIKHLNDISFDLLKNINNFIPINQYPWEKNEPKDDDTFPQVLINLDVFLSTYLTSSKYRKVRLRINRFKNLTKSLNYRNELISTTNLNDTYDFINLYSKNIKAYTNMIETYNCSRKTYSFMINGEIASVFIVGMISSGVIGCYANISNYRDYPAIQEYAFLKLFEQLKKEGFNYFNFGGSEKESLFRFKNKFVPEKLITSNYLVYKK